MAKFKYNFFFSAHIIPGILLILISYIGLKPTIFITILIISFGLNGSVTIACTPNFHDISPNYAGFLYGIIDFVGLTSGFLAPLLAAFFTESGVIFNNRYIFNII